MKKIECIVFNVDHGLCVFISSPNNYGLLIDCGGRQCFSPIKWIRKNYNFNHKNIVYFESRRFAELILTHLHADHFSDIGAFYKKVDKPKILHRDKQVLKIIDEKIKEEKEQSRRQVLEQFKDFQKNYNKEIKEPVDWGFDEFNIAQISYSAAENISKDRDKILNNRSFIIGIKYAGKKILIPGDIETEGWEKAFEDKKNKDILKDTSFFITSHHGHKNGCHKDLLEYTGTPEIYIVSARSKDDTYYDFYSNPKNSKGYKIQGDEKKSNLISTKKREKAIKIIIKENGESSIKLIPTKDNLNKNQQKIMKRKYKKVAGALSL